MLGDEASKATWRYGHQNSEAKQQAPQWRYGHQNSEAKQQGPQRGYGYQNSEAMQQRRLDSNKRVQIAGTTLYYSAGIYDTILVLQSVATDISSLRYRDF